MSEASSAEGPQPTVGGSYPGLCQLQEEGGVHDQFLKYTGKGGNKY